MSQSWCQRSASGCLNVPMTRQVFILPKKTSFPCPQTRPVIRSAPCQPQAEEDLHGLSVLSHLERQGFRNQRELCLVAWILDPCHRCCSKWGLQNCPSSRQLWTRANADGGPPLAVFQDRSLNVAQQPDIQKPLVPLSLHSGLLGISQGLGSPLDKEGGDIEETAKGWAKSKCTAVKRARSRSITKEETSVSQKSPKQRQPPMHE